MHRCFVSPEAWRESGMPLTGGEKHHLLNVLRASDGDHVGVFDGCGREAVARLELRGGDDPVLRIVSDVAASPGAIRIVLIQAIPKGKRMDLIVEKATELGVSSIWPVLTERVVARPDERKRFERADRWQRIALGAARQCGVAWVPDVLPVADPGEVMERCSALDLLLLGSLSRDAAPIGAAIENARPGLPGNGSVGMLIGPEGDFTPDEIRMAVECGAVPVSLGARVLRVETAALYALSVMAYEFL